MKKRVFRKPDQKRASSRGQGKSGLGRGKYQPKKALDRAERLPKDSGFMDTEPMSIEERKAAQLAKWRKELGLEE